MAPPPPLSTPRLRLRAYEPRDRDAFMALITDAVTMRFVGDGQPATPERAHEVFWRVFDPVYKEGRFDVWAVCAREDGRYVGHAETKPRPDADDHEVVYILPPREWGKGYATEILRALVEDAFGRLGLARLAATIAPENKASQRVAAKAGFRFEREWTEDDGSRTQLWAVTRSGAPQS